MADDVEHRIIRIISRQARLEPASIRMPQSLEEAGERLA